MLSLSKHELPHPELVEGRSMSLSTMNIITHHIGRIR